MSRFRKRIPRHRANRQFRRNANRSHAINGTKLVMRGGIRL